MTNLLFLTALTLLGADVQAKPLSGPAIDGRLSQLSAERITVETAEGKQTFRGLDLLFITNPDAEPQTGFKAQAWIKLVDGTLIAATRFSSTNNLATIELAGGNPLEIPTRQIAWVRFHPPSEPLAAQWADAVDRDLRGDRIVVRKSPQLINYLEGLVGDVDDQVAKFRYDGSDVPAPRERLEGLVYFHALKPEFATPACQVVDANGSTWLAKSIELTGDSVDVVCLNGIRVTIALEQVSKFDFSTGNLTFLSDIEPQTQEWTPWFASAALPKPLEDLYSPKLDRAFGSGPMLLRRRGSQLEFDKGLSLHSRTRLVYRLTGEHKKLIAQVGIDARMGNAGSVDLVISGDGRELFRRSVSGEDDAFTLDLDIQRVRRLEILVDYGKNMDLADHLNLCDAMLTQ